MYRGISKIRRKVRFVTFLYVIYMYIVNNIQNSSYCVPFYSALVFFYENSRLNKTDKGVKNKVWKLLIKGKNFFAAIFFKYAFKCVLSFNTNQ